MLYTLSIAYYYGQLLCKQQKFVLGLESRMQIYQ
jgi:hypothetical protein